MSNDDDKHDPVEEVDYNKRDNETKPERIHDNPAAVDSEKKKC